MGGRLWVPVASGPLAPYASGYGSWLAARGYSRWTISHRLRQLELLSGWLESEELAAGDLLAGVRGAVLAGAPCGWLFAVVLGAKRGATG